jgi:multidrug efflux system membrane fusion protein
MKFTLLFIALATLLTACNKEVAPPVRTERPALTRLVGKSAAAGSHQYSGEIRARHEVDLGFRTGGKIVERRVTAGAQVKAGEVLARLDPADNALQAGAAQAQYQLAESDAKRYRELHNKGFVSQSALDAKETALQAAKAQAGLTRNQTDYTTLRAEHDGVVEVILADVGQVVSAGQPVLRLAQAGEAEVAIEIPEDQLAQRHVGDSAVVLVGNDAPLNGRLRELSSSADPVSRTYPARVAFVAAPGKVALGMTARVRFEPDASKQTTLLIPLSAVYQQGKQTAVWIVAANHSVSLRQVEISAYRDDGAVIAGGLKAGERIVSAGVHRLSNGEVIQPVDDGSAQ